jgi:hypothetical protein
MRRRDRGVSQPARRPTAATRRRAARAKTVKKHAPAFEIRTPLYVLTGGADLSQIHSIGRRPRCNWSLRSAPT